MKYLELYLSGVMQSYGTKESPWLNKYTADIPTRDAVAGLLACAFGISDKDSKDYQDLLSLDMYAKKKESKYENDRHRADRRYRGGGILTDYQIVRPLEPGKTKEESRFLCVDGKYKAQIPRKKYYLEDQAFSVLLGSEDEEFLEDIHYAIRHPLWCYYLGRACCTPSSEIVPEQFVLTEKKPAGEWRCI